MTVVSQSPQNITKIFEFFDQGAAALKSARRMLRRIWEAHDSFNRVPC